MEFWKTILISYQNIIRRKSVIKTEMIENTKTKNTFEKANNYALVYLKDDSKIDDLQGRKTSLSAQANYFTRVIVVLLLCLQIQMQPFFWSVSVVSLPLTHWVAAIPSSASWMYKRRAWGRQIKTGTSHFQASFNYIFQLATFTTASITWTK